MTIIFGNEEMAQEIISKMPLQPSQIIINKTKKEFKIMFSLAEINEFNEVNAVATAYENNFIKTIKVQMPKITSIQSAIHYPNKIEYHLRW